jgi:hypothetical protein
MPRARLNAKVLTMAELPYPITATDVARTDSAHHVRWFLGEHGTALLELASRHAARTWIGHEGRTWLARVLSNGSFYLVSDSPRAVWIIDCEAHFVGKLAADAAGLALSLRCLEQLAGQVRSVAVQAALHGVREYARQHAERSALAVLGVL